MNDILATIRRTIVPIRREGYPFIAIGAAAALVLFLIGGEVLGWIALAITAWIIYFFRDPPRVTPVDANLVVSPADGQVSAVTEAVPPAELGLGDTALPRVSVFMNVFDVHVNRTPVAGRVQRMAYRAGKFLNAELDKASEDNERNGFVIEADAGATIAVVQIAGLVARRIVVFVDEGARLAPGERIGLIRFGSRVDVYLPVGTRPLVGIGQRAVAGETVFAELGSAGASREEGWRRG